MILPKCACIVLLAVAATGPQSCEQQTSEVGPQVVPTQSARFTVESQGTFNAGLDHHLREIIIITDTQTQKQYLGITGVGITELFVGSSDTTTEE